MSDRGAMVESDPYNPPSKHLVFDGRATPEDCVFSVHNPEGEPGEEIHYHTLCEKGEYTHGSGDKSGRSNKVGNVHCTEILDSTGHNVEILDLSHKYALPHTRENLVGRHGTHHDMSDVLPADSGCETNNHHELPKPPKINDDRSAHHTPPGMKSLAP